MLTRTWSSRVAATWVLPIFLLTSTLTAQSSSAPAADSGLPSPLRSPSALPDSTKLEVINAPQPDYPLEAAAKGLQGKVMIQLHISETGDVISTEIVSGDALLAHAAEDAMKEWKFKPFVKNGKPVRVSYKMPYEYVLKGYTGDSCAAVETVQATNLAHHHSHAVIPQAVMEGSLIHRVEPEYPMIAKMRHLQGKVILQATIGQDGQIHNLTPLCGRPEFIPTCVEAVRQWRYRPYMLEGNPVEVETTIKVEFRM
jgi:TonB family protein